MIRAWQPFDWPAISGMLAEFLHASVQRGGDVLPTERNVRTLWSIGLGWAAIGQPTLLAEDETGVLGYVQWGWLDSPFDVRWRTCHALGSYTRTDVRGLGIAGSLRMRAKGMCIEAGIERIVGPVHLSNPRGVAEFIGQGAWPTTVQMELLV